jgi:hypothetical protein
VTNRLIPLAVLKCLFAVAGELKQGADGRFRVTRLSTNEIIGCDTGGSHILFSEIRKRYSRSQADLYPATTGLREGVYVQQFRFLRLHSQINYEPIIMALKGIQISMLPGSFLTPAQYLRSGVHRERFEDLLEWGCNPSPISEDEAEVFLTNVDKGLKVEKRGKPSHSEAYIAWAISELRQMLRDFNRRLKGQPSDPSVSFQLEG